MPRIRKGLLPAILFSCFVIHTADASPGGGVVSGGVAPSRDVIKVQYDYGYGSNWDYGYSRYYGGSRSYGYYDGYGSGYGDTAYRYGRGYGTCEELRRSCEYKDQLNEWGYGNCRRYYNQCGGGAGYCGELRKACLYNDDYGQSGYSTCERYRDSCRGSRGWQ
jgi:hypothetical protein